MNERQKQDGEEQWKYSENDHQGEGNYEKDYGNELQDVEREKREYHSSYQDFDQKGRKEYDELRGHEIEKLKVKYRKHSHEEGSKRKGERYEEPEVSDYKGQLDAKKGNNNVT